MGADVDHAPPGGAQRGFGLGDQDEGRDQVHLQHLPPQRRRRAQGCIVNIGTHAGVRPKGSSIPYAASKAALHHVTKLLALALAPDVRVNAVAPGLVETPMTANWPDMLETWNTRAPMRRPAKPEDIADLVAALIANDYVTGEVVIADGGLNLT